MTALEEALEGLGASLGELVEATNTYTAGRSTIEPVAKTFDRARGDIEKALETAYTAGYEAGFKATSTAYYEAGRKDAPA